MLTGDRVEITKLQTLRNKNPWPNIQDLDVRPRIGGPLTAVVGISFWTFYGSVSPSMQTRTGLSYAVTIGSGRTPKGNMLYDPSCTRSQRRQVRRCCRTGDMGAEAARMINSFCLDDFEKSSHFALDHIAVEFRQRKEMHARTKTLTFKVVWGLNTSKVFSS